VDNRGNAVIKVKFSTKQGLRMSGEVE
jgi:hypothetical protein